MADETRVVAIKLVIDADNAIEIQQQVRNDVEQIKAGYKELAATTSQSLADINESFKRVNINPLREQIRNLKQEVRTLQDLKEELGPVWDAVQLPTGDTAEQVLQTRILELESAQERLVRTSYAASQATKELGQDIRGQEKSVADLEKKTQQLTEIQSKLAASSTSAIQTNATLAQTFNNQKSAISATTAEIRKDVELIKRGFIELGANSSKSVSEISAAFKRVNIEPLKVQIAQIKAEIRSLEQTARKAKLAGFTEESSKLLDVAAQKSTDLAQAQSLLKRTQTAASQATKELNQAFKEQESSVTRLGDVTQRVFRSIMGFLVLNVLRNLMMAMGELTERGDEFRNAINRMSISVRTLQRQGMEITFQEISEVVDELARKFTNLNETSLREGVAALFLLGQRLSLTKDQMINLSEATAALAAHTGIEYKEAIDRVGRALSTGQTQGLTDLVGGITETTIKQEAQRLGLIDYGDALTDVSRVQAIYSLILRESGLIAEDVELAQKTLVGRYNEETEAVQKLKDSLGSKLIPVEIAQAKATALVLGWLNKAIIAAAQLALIFESRLVAAFTIVTIAFNELVKGNIVSLEELAKTYKEVQDIIFESRLPELQELLDPQGLGDAIGEGLGDATDLVETEGDDLVDAYDNLFAKLREAMIDGQERLAAENRKFLQEMLERQQRFDAKLQAENEKYLFDQGKVWRQYYDDLEDLNRKYREKEIDAEEDFQEKIRDLRNKFLDDLEDALQQRDARQVLRLIKDFNRRQNELRRQRGREQEDLDEQKRREEEELKRRRDRRLRELRIEYQFRLQQMRQQEALERKLAEEAHINRMKELQIQTQQRLEQIVRQFNDEHEITKDGAAAIADALMVYFGPNGQIKSIYDYMLTMTDSFNMQFMQRLQDIKNGIISSGIGDYSPSVPEIPKSMPKDYSKVPTMPPGPGSKNSGASGMSTANFASSAAMRQQSFTNLVPKPSMGGGGSNGKASIVISLQDGLVGEIVDQSLGEVADVFVRMAGS